MPDVVPHTPARILWLLPSLIEGSGGHRTMLQNIEALEHRGHRCFLAIEPEGGASGPRDAKAHSRALDRLQKWFGVSMANGLAERVVVGWDRLVDPAPGQRMELDMVVATAWYSARVARDIPGELKRVYFVQDYEAWFMPMGDGYLKAEESYQYGLVPLTIGKWLTRNLAHRFGCAGTWFDFCADLTVYGRDASVQRTPSVCFIYQPEKPRRCPAIGVEALGIVKHHRPDVKIVFYGSKESSEHLWFEHENRGLVSVAQCNRIYNECQVGLCISSSNPSRIPFEMMACGLPVVDVHRPNNIYDMPEEGVMLAGTRPEQIASAVLALLEDEQRREAMGRFGTRFMAQRDLAVGYHQFGTAVEHVLRGRTQGWSERARAVEPMYHRPASAAAWGADQQVLSAPASKVMERIELQASARRELEAIERSKAWRVWTGVKRSPLYRAVARMRYGEGWELVEPKNDAVARLRYIRASRAYRTIVGAKQSNLLRMVRGGRGGGGGAARPMP